MAKNPDYPREHLHYEEPDIERFTAAAGDKTDGKACGWTRSEIDSSVVGRRSLARFLRTPKQFTTALRNSTVGSAGVASTCLLGKTTHIYL